MPVKRPGGTRARTGRPAGTPGSQALDGRDRHGANVAVAQRDHPRIPARRHAGRRRHGYGRGGAPPRRNLPPALCGQAAPGIAEGRRGRPHDVPRRGAARRADPTPQRRQRARRGRRRGRALPRHGADRGGLGLRADQRAREEAALLPPPAGAPGHRRGGARAARGARAAHARGRSARPGAPRRVAAEHPDRVRRQRPRDRLRRRQGRRTDDADGQRAAQRQDGLHVAGAAALPRSEPPLRPLRARGRALRAVDQQPALPIRPGRCPRRDGSWRRARPIPARSAPICRHHSSSWCSRCWPRIRSCAPRAGARWPSGSTRCGCRSRPKRGRSIWRTTWPRRSPICAPSARPPSPKASESSTTRRRAAAETEEAPRRKPLLKIAAIAVLAIGLVAGIAIAATRGGERDAPARASTAAPPEPAGPPAPQDDTTEAAPDDAAPDDAAPDEHDDAAPDDAAPDEHDEAAPDGVSPRRTPARRRRTRSPRRARPSAPQPAQARPARPAPGGQGAPNLWEW